MSDKEIHRGWVARQLFGLAGDTVKLASGLLQISDEGTARAYRVAEMRTEAVLTKGWVWASLKVRISGKIITLNGFGKPDLLSFTQKLNHELYAHAEKTLQAESADLFEISIHIQELLETKHYIRDSQRLQILARAERAIKVQQHHYWRFYATDQQRRTAEWVKRFINNSDSLVQDANERFINHELDMYQEFFDTIEKKPLTPAQRRACVVNEDNNLVLAGAGTGKTSTMVGRAGYIISSGQAESEQILMLAFGNKAAKEMRERQDRFLGANLKATSLKIKTFHAFGREIIGKVEGTMPKVSDLSLNENNFTRFIDWQINKLFSNPQYVAGLIQYFSSHLYPYRNPFDFYSMQQYEDHVRHHRLRTIRGEAVKSFEDIEVANFLFLHGIDYKYDVPYIPTTFSPNLRCYKPNFYLPEYNIYIEHFILNKEQKPPRYFKQQEYLDSLVWRREVHQTNGTQLLEVNSYMKNEGCLQSFLSESLRSSGVPLIRRPNEEILIQLKANYNVSDLGRLVSMFLALFKQSFLSWESLCEKAKSHIDSERLCFLLSVIHPVFDAYQYHLKTTGEIDFNDMIGRAIEYIENGQYQSPYTHILVDEFQDISAGRARLIQAALRQRPGSGLFAVGDDWQSIYRFTGSDIRLITQFEKHFGATAITLLDLTFRFNNKIGEVASSFVLRNPEQISKIINSHSHVSESAISLISTINMEHGLKLALKAINQQVDSESGVKASVLVLGRYNFVNRITADLSKSDFPLLNIRWMTAHSAKGKEADYVIILGLDKGKLGFPTEMETDSILDLLLPPEEVFKDAEERRLFYVAMTRARHRVYVVYNPQMVSSFIRELIGKDYDVCIDEFDSLAIYPDVACPLCKEGNLIIRKGNYGTFVGCNNYPDCSYISTPCLVCGGIMKEQGRFKVCLNDLCDAVEPVCPNCGAGMVIRTNRQNGMPFWGCSNYASQVCSHTIDCTDIPGKKELLNTSRRDFCQKDQGAPVLFVDLIPRSAWFSNLRSELTEDEWRACQRLTYKNACYRCEVCGGQGVEWPVDCHERWEYDEGSGIQRLIGLVALCPECHESTHMGHADINGEAAEATWHLMDVNGWDDRAASNHIKEAFRVWGLRSQIQWTLDATWLLSCGVQISPLSREKILKHAQGMVVRSLQEWQENIKDGMGSLD